MAARKMHADEVDIDETLVAELVGSQFPSWAELPLAPVESTGTDNALFRLGKDLVVRLPRIHWAVAQVRKERDWLPRLAPRLPLEIPVPLEVGEPAAGYPWNWSICRWIEGADATAAKVDDPRQAAVDVAAFLTALWGIEIVGDPPATAADSRGKPLALRDAQTREAIEALAGTMDVEAATAAWEASLAAEDWKRDPVLYHGDLMLGNLIVNGGRLRAVIDFSGLGVGDPACDLMIAWSLFSGASRARFREETGVDDATWERGRGHALSQALIFIPYYEETNPIGVANARKVIDAVLADFHRPGYVFP